MQSNITAWLFDDIVCMSLGIVEAFGRDTPLQQTSVNVWIGSKGVITPSHYDTAHNMYVQMVGSKRIRICPPTCAIDLSLAPNLTPAHRHVTRRLDHTPVCHDNFDIVLHEGDAVFIPAYWYVVPSWIIVSTIHCYQAARGRSIGQQHIRVVLVSIAGVAGVQQGS